MYECVSGSVRFWYFVDGWLLLPVFPAASRFDILAHLRCMHLCASPPPFCRSFQCGNAYSFVSLLHSSIHAGHFHQRVMAGYEFHFVSFIIETDSDQCVHSNNHLLFLIHTRAHTRTYIPLFPDSLSLSLNYAPRFRYNCTTSQRVIQHWSTFLLFKWRFYWRSIWPHFFLPLIN